MTDGSDRTRPDRPTVDDPDVSGLTSHDREIAAALIDVLSDGEGSDALGFSDWAIFGKALLAYRDHDPENVVIAASSTGVELIPRSEFLEQREALSSTADLASRYLRRVEGWPVDEIEQLDDLELVQAFLDASGNGETDR